MQIINSYGAAYAAGLDLNKIDLREPIVKDCKECKKHSGGLCNVYPYPNIMWRRGNCLMATHIYERITENEGKVRVGQQKQRRM